MFDNLTIAAGKKQMPHNLQCRFKTTFCILIAEARENTVRHQIFIVNINSAKPNSIHCLMRTLPEEGVGQVISC